MTYLRIITSDFLTGPGLALVSGLLLSMAAEVVVADTAAGVEAFEAGNYETAYEELNPGAEAGDPVAQYYLGGMYLQGSYVEKDLERARHWLRLASKQSYAPAKLELGYLYSNGIGVATDNERAVSLYREAAEAGNAVAQSNLGLMYRDGEGVGQDLGAAVVWFRRAAEQGDVVGQTRLGQLLWLGMGADKDSEESVEWLEKAARQDHAPAQYLLCSKHTSLYPPRAPELVEGMMWCKLAADQGHTGASNMWEAATRWFVTGEQKDQAARRAAEWTRAH